MTACVALRSRRNISFLMWKSLTMMMTMMMKMRRKKSLHPTMTRHLPVHQTPTHQREGVPAAVGTLSRASLTWTPQAPVPYPVRSAFRGGCGPADEPPHRAAGGHCSPGEVGSHRREVSPPAVRAARPAAASPHVWSCPRPSVAFPPGQNCPHPADTCQPPLKEGRRLPDPFLLFDPSHPAPPGHHKLGPLPFRSGYSSDQWETCLGRAPEQREVMS